MYITLALTDVGDLTGESYRECLPPSNRADVGACALRSLTATELPNITTGLNGWSQAKTLHTQANICPHSHARSIGAGCREVVAILQPGGYLCMFTLHIFFDCTDTAKTENTMSTVASRVVTETTAYTHC